MKRLLPILLLAAGLPTPLFAGAWTMPQGETQIITNVTYSRATESFSDSGSPNIPTSFDKLWSSISAEYGLTNGLTLILNPEFARATVAPHEYDSDFAMGGGLRYRLLDNFGVLSAQATVKSAGAFDMSVSAGRDSGKEGEFRLLYGTNFSLLKHAGFADVEVAERWIEGARPNETAADLSLGLHLSAHSCLLLQSFNVIAGGDARPPYTYYRIHKVSLSEVFGPWHGLSLQTGAFVSPLGQNSLVETGVFAALWTKF